MPNTEGAALTARDPAVLDMRRNARHHDVIDRRAAIYTDVTQGPCQKQPSATNGAVKGLGPLYAELMLDFAVTGVALEKRLHTGRTERHGRLHGAATHSRRRQECHQEEKTLARVIASQQCARPRDLGEIELSCVSALDQRQRFIAVR
jgi:hypothetical protein